MAARNHLDKNAPGHPGRAARWASSAKSGVGTAIDSKSRIWFTLSHGILNEVYFPFIDHACTRDAVLIVTDRRDFFSEEKRDAETQIEWLQPGVPAFRLVNSCRKGHYQIEKQIITDPKRNTLLQLTRFFPKKKELENYSLYFLIAPHLSNHGNDNTGWIGEYRGRPFLFARRKDCALAIVCSVPWLKMSAGYVGKSDGWTDLKKNKKMTWEYTRAEQGNVALTGEIDLKASNGQCLIVIGFGKNESEAAKEALASLHRGFNSIKAEYSSGWKKWIKSHSLLKKSTSEFSLASLAVLRTHETKVSSGGLIASLSFPWGNKMGDNDLNAYHFIWPRDMVEIAGAFLSVGAFDDVRQALKFFQRTQQNDGYWPQNMRAEGSVYRSGIQLDETALPLLLVDLAFRKQAISEKEYLKFWPMVKQAAGYLLRHGPASAEDRWEMNGGFSTFTISVVIAALLIAAEMAEHHREIFLAAFLRETADAWNGMIDYWLFATDTPLCKKHHIRGYYAGLAPVSERGLSYFLKHRGKRSEKSKGEVHQIISPDALALVRFGLRYPDDPRIIDTIKIIDKTIKIHTPKGPTWHRYNGDRYGEKIDGSPHNGKGIGRGWPLLTGERGHYAVAAEKIAEAKYLFKTLEAFANEGKLISEQVWDRSPIPSRSLFPGEPTGAAMPLAWAHAEYLKLMRSIQDRSVFDMPAQTKERYLKKKIKNPRWIWRREIPVCCIPCELLLRIETIKPSSILWTCDGWKTHRSVRTQDSKLGIHFADLDTMQIPSENEIQFKFQGSTKRYHVKIKSAPGTCL